MMLAIERPATYWENRAQRFARAGEGLAAVCSYGMPVFYNRLIHLCQGRSLAPWLVVPPGARVLDIGCGVGRWSRRLAARGARVTGIDLSPTMIEEAARRARASGVAERCRFLVQDCAELEVEGPFDLILSVTVLQHILDVGALRSAVRRIASRLAPNGRLVVLEAAPQRTASHCNSPIFRARHRDFYRRLFEECGLSIRAVTGVDPAPFKTWLLPHLVRLPRPAALGALALATALSAPIDVPFGRLMPRLSWHAVLVLEHAGGGAR